jgi:hypothetical protein
MYRIDILKKMTNVWLSKSPFGIFGAYTLESCKVVFTTVYKGTNGLPLVLN